MVVERVECVKELLLRSLATGEELDVVQDQKIHLPEALLELAHPVPAQRADELGHERLGGEVCDARERIAL